MSNTHIATAKFRQEGVHDWQERMGEDADTILTAITDAQVEATLALAYEQRTANLIAYEQFCLAADVASIYPRGIETTEIRERLDLA